MTANPGRPPRDDDTTPPPVTSYGRPPAWVMQLQHAARVANQVLGVAVTVVVVDLYTHGVLRRELGYAITRLRRHLEHPPRLPTVTEISALHTEARTIIRKAAGDETAP